MAADNLLGGKESSKIHYREAIFEASAAFVISYTAWTQTFINHTAK
jgi:hypothetical protein